MEIEFRLEFLVSVTPVSSQSARSESREAWKAHVRSASVMSLPSPHLASEDRMSLTLYYLPKGPMQGDIDNIVKLVIDTLSEHVHIDDSQVDRIVVQ